MTGDYIAAVVVAGISMCFILLMIFSGYVDAYGNPFTARRRRKQLERERTYPLYERLALADEREGDKWLEAGKVERAVEHYQRASKFRREAADALMRGELYPDIDLEGHHD